jgi:hypothetical protein
MKNGRGKAPAVDVVHRVKLELFARLYALRHLCWAVAVAL